MRLPRALSLLAALLVTMSAAGFAQTGEEEPENLLQRSFEIAQERRDHVKKKADEAIERRVAEAKRHRDDLDSKGKEAEKVGEELDVRSNDVLVERVKEPATQEEVVGRTTMANPWDASEKDYDIQRHEIWSLRPEDFRFRRPSRITIERPLGARAPYDVDDLVPETKRTVFRDAYLVLPFVLTNSTDKDLLIYPHMWLVSENLRFTPEIGGFIAQQDVENSMYRDMLSTADLVGYDSDASAENVKPVQAFQAGETHYGVAVFPTPDLEMDKMTLVVEGLNNTYRFDRRQKRVLAVEFEHAGDEFYPFRESMEFRGKEWKWLWMWNEEMQVAPPQKYEFPTPTEARQKALWAYQVTLTNHSREAQELEIREFNTVVEARAMGVKVEVEFVDNGESTIHKAQVMEEMAQPFKGERFIKGTLEPEEVKVFPVIFDEQDIAWEKVYEQVRAGLMWDEEAQKGLSIGYGEEPLEPGLGSFIPDEEKLKRVLDRMKNVRLTPEKKERIREEVVAGLAEAFEAERTAMRVTANVTAVSGIASGTIRIRRSYRKPGVIEPDWIHKWEE
jgi:phage shock protein PspC (stress-responsive transcriptional regulator)